ncbi:MAG: DUF3597 domain-containing protein [Sphingomonas sp.]|nr:DUF3597 domain-containing protein [Sphingomonas sp.]
MGIFSKIKDAIFGRKAEAQDAPEANPTPITRNKDGDVSLALQTVDIENVLEMRSKGVEQELNWRTSIVDLMKLVNLDPSYENRKELAQEMGRTDYSGTAEDNIWLHKRVMQELAENGGRVPKELM